MERVRIIIYFLFAVIFLQVTITAQYFGRNKIQYEDFDFKVLKNEEFNIYHYPEMYETVEDASSMLNKWNERFSRIFGFKVKDQPIILYANHPDFQQTNVISSFISQGTGGVTEGYMNRIAIPLTGIYEENDHVLGHELVHAYQYTIIKSKERGMRNAAAIPLWFIEGMAEYLSIGSQDPLTAMWMRDAVLNDDIPTISDVSTNQKYFPYRYGHALWNFIASGWGDSAVYTLFDAVLDVGLKKGIDSTLGIGTDSLSTLWRNSMEETYSPILENLDPPNEVGDSVLGGEGSINLSPVISPNGKYIALISRQELFTLDLYLIDASTGNVIKKLASSETNEHFDALRFMNSSGAWSPDGEKFAFVAIRNGDNAVAIVDVETTKIERTIKVDSIDGITDVSWSPDGDKIAIAGSYGGIGDLYLFDLNNNTLTQLTDDKYAQIQPNWSPDGTKIAFVTDQNENTEMKELRFGKMCIGILDLESGNIETIAISEKAKHINPYFSKDGDELFFVADPDGISNIYRYSFNDKRFYKITNIATGVTGLTELSPAMSYAQETGKLVFTVFDKTDHKLKSIETTVNNGEPYTPSGDEYVKNVTLPPQDKEEAGIVDSYFAIDEHEVKSDSVKLTDYSPSLQLLSAGYTSIGIGVSRFGTELGGATNFLWSDMLGNHWLSTTALVNGTFKDIGAEVVYINRKRRYNYGAAAGHIPYRSGGVVSGVDTVTINGTQYLAPQTTLIIQRIFSDRVSLLMDYPISQNRRWEFTAGFNHISYDIETETFTTLGGVVIDYEEGELDAPSPLNLVSGSVAYVGDYSYFGFTSPIQGSRYRFEAEPTLGTLNFSFLLADYRHYFFAEPVTFAFRALHYGRYFEDSEDRRLSPLQVGYHTLVRGYDVNSFSAEEFAAGGSVDEYNRLLGSKIGVLNFEIRVPLFGNDQFGLISFPYLPLEISLFGDAGVAWTNDDPPKIKFDQNTDERVPVFSTGIAARINILGYAIGQVYYAIPFQRSGKDHVWGFVLSPGW